MAIIYLGAGHGIRPDGSYDSGGDGGKGLIEHELNRHVVAPMTAGL